MSQELLESAQLVFEKMVTNDKRNSQHPASKVINIAKRPSGRYIDSRTEAMFEGFALALLAVNEGLITLEGS